MSRLPTVQHPHCVGLQTGELPCENAYMRAEQSMARPRLVLAKLSGKAHEPKGEGSVPTLDSIRLEAMLVTYYSLLVGFQD